MVQPGEDDTALAESRRVGLALGDDLRLDVGRDGGVELPSSHLGVLLTGGAGRSAQCVNLEVGVSGEELDEPLADGTGRAEDTDFDLVLRDHDDDVICVTSVS